MRPRQLHPSFREKVWGATQLQPWFPDSDRKIGEVWFEDAGELSLLVKFIFTSEKLSVQVHPGDEYARAHHNSPGKTEMWHVLRAGPDAKIAAGFREPLSRKRLEDAARSGEIEDLLEWYPARAGDTFFIPAGTVHAIGPGLAICEIQQHSDVTYRLYDYGRPRELHIERALDVCARIPHPARAESQGNVLVSSPYFTTSRLIAQSTTRLPPAADFELLIAIEGRGEIAGSPLEPGQVWYVPPDCPPFDIHGDVTLLLTGPPAK